MAYLTTRQKKVDLLSYIEILKRLNLKPTLRGPWAVVRKATQVQGWKLHLSSVPVEAVKLLSIVVPFLSQCGVSFKVAKDERVLFQLNEGEMGATQVGKFITIYPDSAQESRQLADQLIEMTKEFHGPIIVSDLRLGGIVYTRYGGFNPIVTRDRLGQTFLSIYAPDGTLRIDSYEVPFVPPANVPNPFDDYSFVTSRSQHTTQTVKPQMSSSKLFGPGYLVIEVLKQHPKGSTFLSVDLRSQEQIGIKVIKQGRQYCLSDEYGRDMRTRLKHQEALHNNLYSFVPIPKVDPYFEVKGDGYLPVEYIEGQTIEMLAVDSLANRAWNCLFTNKQVKLLSYLKKVVTAVQKMHAVGYVHRDLTASNIWIGADEQVYLLDLELAHHVDDPTPAFGLGTAGFMSPEQEDRKPPAFTDDIYALGCITILLLTGIDPRRILFASEKDRILQLLELTNGAPLELIEIIAQAVKSDPNARPDLETINTLLEHCIASLPKSTGQVTNTLPVSSITQQSNKSVRNQVSDLITTGQDGLLKDVISDRVSGLWLSSAISTSSHQGMRSAIGSSYELCRSANRGVAGVVYLLGRLARFGYGTQAVRERVQQAIQWLLSSESTSDEQLPGLHFGEAGVAVAMAEAISGGLIERDSQIDAFLSKALSGKLDWPDITHGAAGQGIAILYCADRLQDSALLNLTHPCADYLITCQKGDGSWAMPLGVDGMSGQTLTGFAHGVSGIVYFLAEYAQRFGSIDAHKAWQAGIDWLIKQAIPTKGFEGRHAFEWHYSLTNDICWKWWCHGSPGIALTFLRLYEQTEDSIYAEVATKALQIHPINIRYPNLSQCHGLSGLGEIYLEAGRVLGDEQWLERAEVIAKNLIHLRRETSCGSVTWLVEDPNIATADLMVGSSGVLHFFLKLSLNAKKVGFPLLLDPVWMPKPGSHLGVA